MPIPACIECRSLLVFSASPYLYVVSCSLRHSCSCSFTCLGFQSWFFWVFLRLEGVSSRQDKGEDEVYHTNYFSAIEQVRGGRSSKTSLASPSPYTPLEIQGFILSCIPLDWWHRKEKLMSEMKIPGLYSSLTDNSQELCSGTEALFSMSQTLRLYKDESYRAGHVHCIQLSTAAASSGSQW